MRFNDSDEEMQRPLLARRIKPTGRGYRAVSHTFLGIGAGLGAVALLVMAMPGGLRDALFFLYLMGLFLSVGFVLRVLSDFLAALADISRALRERE